MSFLREGGIVLGVALVSYAFVRMRRSGLRPSVNIAILLGILLSLISIDPDIVNILASVMQVRNQPLGRLVALLVASSIALWIGLLHERAKREEFTQRMSKLLDGFVADVFRQDNLTQSAPIVVLIPAYNEAEALPRVLPRIPPSVLGYATQVCVVDDGSVDGTEAVAVAGGATVFRVPGNRGGGAALRVGYRVLVSAGAQIIVTLDADGQHDPLDMPNLVKPILDGEADFVIGSRILGRSESSTRLRAVGVRLFSKIVSWMTGIAITDCSSGYRAFRTELVPELELVEDQFHTTETIIRLARCGVRLREVPISIQRRLAGKSKKGPDVRYGWRVARAMLKSWLRPSETVER